MLDFRRMTLVRRRSNDNWSFVGIQNKNGHPEFCLPIGFDDFPDNDFVATRDLFFRMYRTFRRFAIGKGDKIESTYPSQRDEIQREKGIRFHLEDGEEVLLYSKIGMLEAVLNDLDEVAIRLLQKKPATSNKIDYTQLHKYLHQAVYLPDDVIYIDEMTILRPQIEVGQNDLIDMYCFIYSEIKDQLEEMDEVDESLKTAAYRFHHNHLTSNQSIFDEYSYESTILALKDILETIDQQTGYKDHDYWLFFEAIEIFLYGSLNLSAEHDGIIWGISNFSAVWEEMCFAYIFQEFAEDILFADTNMYINGRHIGNSQLDKYNRVFLANDFFSPATLSNGQDNRQLRPDLIRKIYVKLYQLSKASSEGTYRLILEVPKKVLKTIYYGKRNQKGLQRNLIYEGFSPSRKLVKDKPIIINKVKPEKYATLEKIVRKAIEDSVRKSLTEYMIIDFKYQHENVFTSTIINSKVEKDIVKQLVYEYALQIRYKNYSIRSQFCIPHYYPPEDENLGDLVPQTFLNPIIQDSTIEILKTSFLIVQKAYLK